MALLTFLPENKQQQQHQKQPSKRRKKLQNQTQNANPNPKQKQKQPSSWDQFKNLLSCKQIDQPSNVIDPISKNNYSKLGSSCSSICSFRDVVHGNTRVVHRADINSPESSSVGQETGLLSRKPGHRGGSSSLGNSSRSNYTTSSSRGMQFRKLSGCYECHMIVDPSRYPMPRTTICACPRCGEVFPKPESLELHQRVRHAVSELGPDDSGRNIVEIIFKSSWLKKDNICKIERILKVHNTQRTIQRFEDCRDAVKSRALTSTKKNPRCAADGNELLRFHCTKLSCGLGARGSSSLCGSIPGCGVCTTIRRGFQGKEREESVCTTASSGRAHDSLIGCTDGRRAMLVCRVIAGRVKRVAEEAAEMEEDVAVGGGAYDSVAGYVGVYSNLEELFVFNPKAILPCFVVIYSVDS
ncbi:C2H2-like zinc finger protein [Euphorbia peplus]|nr:C2H2-like zinc finger protein [Euphorbia peplus]